MDGENDGAAAQAQVEVQQAEMDDRVAQAPATKAQAGPGGDAPERAHAEHESVAPAEEDFADAKVSSDEIS